MPVEEQHQVQVRSQRRHGRILEAALEVFTRKGYHAASVDDIAAESATSKGGVYFHFPGKQAIFLALLDEMTALLRSRAEAAMAAEDEPLRKADAALRVVLETFAGHRTLTRLFLVEARGAGREFHERMADIHESFAVLIAQRLAEAVRRGAIPPLDTAVAGRMWFGALHEVVAAWVHSGMAMPLLDAYPTVRALLLRSVGAPPAMTEQEYDSNGHDDA